MQRVPWALMVMLGAIAGATAYFYVEAESSLEPPATLGEPAPPEKSDSSSSR